MKHLHISYADIRIMPIRYREWYIDRFIKNLNEETRLHNQRIEEFNSKKTSHF